MTVINGYTLLIIILLPIFTILVCGCDENGEEFDDELDNSYLPISVGNWWKYIDPDYPEDGDIVVITGTTSLKDGKTVLIVEADDEKGYISHATHDMIMFHEALDDLKGELVYRPPLTVGATWQSNRSSVKVVSQDTVVTPAGVYENCYRVNARITDDYENTDYYSIWLAKNVGPVMIAEFDPDDQKTKDVIALSSYSVAKAKVP